MSVFRRFLGFVYLSVMVTGVSAVAQDAPQVKNPMNEIGFQKDHVYDFKDIVAVDQLSGSANISIPIAGMKGKGVGAFTLSLQYSASASINVLHAQYDQGANYWEWGINNDYDMTGAMKNPELVWDIGIPSLEQWSPPFGGKPSFHSVQYRTIDFVDEHGVRQTMLEVDDEAGTDQAYYMARGSTAKTETFDYPSFTEGEYSGDILKRGGIRYTGLNDTHTLGTLFGDIMLSLNNDPESPGTLSPTSGLTEVTFSVTKSDPEGNYLKIQTVDSDSDGMADRIKYFNNTDPSRVIQLTGTDGAVTSATSPGMGTVIFDYIDVWVNSRYLKFLKSITFEDNSSYTFDYYFIKWDSATQKYVYNPMPPQEDQTEGNAFLNNFSFQNALGETIDEEIYVPMLSRITLPTGGSIEFRYQAFGCTYHPVNNDGISDIDYYVRLGMKELIYKNELGSVVEKRQYSVFSTGTDIPTASKQPAHFLDAIRSRMTEGGTPPGGNYEIANGVGRRVLVLNGSGEKISLTDQIYHARLGSSQPYMDHQARVVKVYSYADPEAALTAINQGTGFSALVRQETENEYRKRLVTAPFFSSSSSTYFGKFYQSKSTVTKYEGASTIQTISETVYEGLDNSATSEEGVAYQPQSTRGIVVPISTTTTVKENGTDVLTTVSETQYNYLDSPWMVQQTASMKTESGEKWLSTSGYNGTYPWRLMTASSGPGLDDGNGNWSFENSLNYSVTNAYFDDTDRKGLIAARTIQGPGGTPSSITESFDYTAGILTSYTLGSGTNALTTTRTINTETGLVLSQSNPDGTAVFYTWGDMNRLIGIQPEGADGTSLTPTSITYTGYDATNNTPPNVTVTGPKDGKYVYDGLGRLVYEGAGADSGMDWSKAAYNGMEQVHKTWTGLRMAEGDDPATGAWSTVARTETDIDGYGRTLKTDVYESGSTLQSTTELSYAGFTKREILKDSTGTINRVREFVYDAKDNLTGLFVGESEANLVEKTNYTYSPLYNKLLTVTVNTETGSPFQTRSFSYDELGRLTGTVTPEEGSISYSGYNVFGKPASKMHGSKTIAFTYDDLGREISRSQSGVVGSTISTSWGTSGIDTGKIISVTTGDATNGSTIEFDYDVKTGQPSIKTQSVTIDGTPVEKTVTYSYNNDATVQTITFPQETMSGMVDTNRVLTISYAPNQYPSGLSLNLSSGTYSYSNDLVSSASYDATGGMAYNTGDGLRSEYATDNLGRLSDIIHGETGNLALLDIHDYSYDVRGNILSYDLDQYDPVMGSTRTLDQSYDYDIYDRLTDAQYVHTNGGFNQQMWEEGFGYDAVGNMTSKSFDNYSSFTFGTVQTFAGKAYDSKNQDPGMDYDSYGNVTSLNVPDKASPLNLTYNGYNQVISVTEGDSLLEYMYDGEGKRVFKRVAQGDTPVSEHIFVRDLNGNILEEIKREYDPDTETWGDWKWARDYYYFGDKLISSASAE